MNREKAKKALDEIHSVCKEYRAMKTLHPDTVSSLEYFNKTLDVLVDNDIIKESDINHEKIGRTKRN